jgi:PhoPQ-activated pathogenicity-related protein
MSYNGYTFAFESYKNVGLLNDIDGPYMADLFKITDPINYVDRLAKIPTYIMVSSDDEFMSMDWTNIYYD